MATSHNIQYILDVLEAGLPVTLETVSLDSVVHPIVDYHLVPFEDGSPQDILILLSSVGLLQTRPPRDVIDVPELQRDLKIKMINK